jgi:hypothetical protein
MNRNTLKDLLPEKLKPGLTPAEEKLLEAAQQGSVADFKSGDQEKDNPENSEKWGPERTLRAEFLHWLCTNPEATPRIHSSGVAVLGAKITGLLDFTAATLHHPLVISESALKDIILAYAETHLLNFTGSSIGSLFADGLSVKGSIILEKVKSHHEVRLLGAEISSQLACVGATFENPGGRAFSADSLSVKGNLSLAGVTTQGEVRLLGAYIGGQFDCNGASFKNPGGKAFNADNISVKTDIFFSKVIAEGEVQFVNADIGGQFDCIGASIENSQGIAFSGEGFTVKGNISLKNITAKGEVRLPGAKIRGQLDCKEAIFEKPEGGAFIADNIEIAQVFFFNMRKPKGRLSLMHAKVGVLADLEESWPEKDKLLLDGFEYGKLSGPDTPQTAKKRLEWLRLQPEKFFSLQPYEQLAKVFRNAGRESDAKAVLIAKYNDLRKYGKLGRWDWFRNWFFGITIGHGYQTWRVLLIIFAFWLIGSGLFYWADGLGVMQPTKEHFFPSFNAMVYSLDAFVPFINLHQEDFWLPDASRPYGWWFQLYFWIHILAGWVFSTLAALSLTGLIRKD